MPSLTRKPRERSHSSALGVGAGGRARAPIWTSHVGESDSRRPAASADRARASCRPRRCADSRTPAAPLGDPPLVHLQESGHRHEHLAAHLDQGRRVVGGASARRDRAHVRPDVLADLPLPRVAPRTSPPFSYRSDIARPSILSSTDVAQPPPRRTSFVRWRAGAGAPLHARSSSSVARLASDSIGELDAGPSRSRRPARRRRAASGSRRAQLRVVGLELLQLAEQPVVPGVGEPGPSSTW